MSEMTEKLEQVRAALSRIAVWSQVQQDMALAEGLGISLWRGCVAEAQSALAALPTAEEMAQMQREAAAFRWLESEARRIAAPTEPRSDEIFIFASPAGKIRVTVYDRDTYGAEGNTLLEAVEAAQGGTR